MLPGPRITLVALVALVQSLLVIACTRQQWQRFAPIEHALRTLTRMAEWHEKCAHALPRARSRHSVTVSFRGVSVCAAHPQRRSKRLSSCRLLPCAHTQQSALDLCRETLP